MAKDVCDTLGIVNTTRAVDGLDEDEKGVITNDPIGRMQKTATISESGLYSLVLKSRKPEAKAFKRWGTHDVLPAIRKDGAYIKGEEKVKTDEMSGEELLSRAPPVIPKYDRSRVPP